MIYWAIDLLSYGAIELLIYWIIGLLSYWYIELLIYWPIDLLSSMNAKADTFALLSSRWAQKLIHSHFWARDERKSWYIRTFELPGMPGMPGMPGASSRFWAPHLTSSLSTSSKTLWYRRKPETRLFGLVSFWSIEIWSIEWLICWAIVLLCYWSNVLLVYWALDLWSSMSEKADTFALLSSRWAN